MKMNSNKPQDKYLKLSNCIRILVADSVEAAKSGHPGMPLGMADVMTILAFDFLRYNPNDPTWFNRDRLILSAGHGSMLLYAFYYLTGYKDFNIDDLKNFRQLHSKTPGHPEYGAYPAIETTTGPLGQGFAGSVGMAIGAKKYQCEVGSISNYKVYCVVGDGCLMEGISYESASLAGHLNLNNLIVLFDDNQISIDGKVSLTVSENHLQKFEALGWNVNSIDGHDFEEIHHALNMAQNSNKPSFISCRTRIGKGCVNKVDSEEAHGAPLGKLEIELLKQNINFNLKEFEVPEELKNIWENAWNFNENEYNNWQECFNRLSPEKKDYLLPPVVDTQFLENIKPSSNNDATRKSSGRVIEQLVNVNNKIIFGSADLSKSNNMKCSANQVINRDDFSGNYIHYGVRENAMAAIMSGLSLSGFLPIGGTFLVFSDYMRPAIRLSAIMRLHVIYVMTHDSIGVGEDGPNHQPVEHLASLRCMPNLLVLRPANFSETVECWEIALTNTSCPVMLILSRQDLCGQELNKKDKGCRAGAYIIDEADNSAIDITIFASGSEVGLAAEVKQLLKNSRFNVRLVSVPSFELFFNQDKNYINSLLNNNSLKVGIEAASAFGWHSIIGREGMFFGVNEFGISAPAEEVYNYFGLNVEKITAQIIKKIKNESIH